MTSFPLWAERLYNRPIALDRFKNETLCEFADQRIFGARRDKIDATSLGQMQIASRSDEASHYSDTGRKPFLHRGHIAVIPIRGTLVHRGGYVDAQSGLLGYNHIMEQARAAERDPDIKGKFVLFDSGGGECAGMWAAAEELATMTKAEGGKPMYAYLDDRACSAAYVLCSVADKIYGRREVMGGSIAAIINMVDKSKAMERMGLRPVAVRASWADRKARGGYGEAFDDELVAKAETMVEEASEMIVEVVSAMRGIKPQAVRDLRGEVFTGEDLVSFGLMDGIASEQEAWAMLEREIANA